MSTTENEHSHLRIIIVFINVLEVSTIFLMELDVARVVSTFGLKLNNCVLTFGKIDIRGVIEVIYVDVVARNIHILLTEIFNGHPEKSIILITVVAEFLQFRSPFVRLITPSSFPFTLAPRIS